MFNSEHERSRYLHRKLQSNGIQPDDYLTGTYPAIVFHSSSTIITANQAAADLLGYSIDELEGMNAWNLFPPSSTPIVARQLAELSEEPYQVHIRHKGGELILVELKGINMEIEGELIRAILARRLDQD